VKLLSGSIDAFTIRAPDDLVDQLLNCSKELERAIRGGDVQSGVVERSLEALERWEAYKNRGNGQGSDDQR
jgi:hypothetical protein